MMTLYERSARRLFLSRLMSVIVCLCAFTCLPVPQLIMLTWAESTETERPVEEDGESSQEEQVVSASNRRRLNNRPAATRQSSKTGGLVHRTVSYGSRPPAIIGHQLANGLRAPLVI